MLVKRPSARDGLHTFPIAFGREWLRCVPQAIEELSGWAASDVGSICTQQFALWAAGKTQSDGSNAMAATEPRRLRKKSYRSSGPLGMSAGA
jgi:hypothetical protein